MRGFGAVRVGTLLCALLVCAPAAAANEQLSTSGSIVYTWHGDPARGCAQAGVCGVHGALVTQPQGGAYVFSDGRSGGALNFNQESSTVRVRDGELGSAAGTCVDQLSPSAGFAQLSWTAGGSVSAHLGVGASSGRCAGPTPLELAQVLIHGRRSAGPRRSFDLRGSIPLTAGPFSGTVVSTLRLQPAPPGSGSGSSSSSSSSRPSKLHRVLVEHVELRYRLTIAPSALDVSFRGEDGPFCAVLDTCGASGSLTVSLGPHRAGVEIFASRIVPRRVNRRRAIEEFRAGKVPFQGAAPTGVPAPQLTETFRGAGSGTCTDSAPLANVALGFGSFGPASGPRLPVTLISFSNTDPLRTHCPGPEFADVFGQNQRIAGTQVSEDQLLQRQSTLTLARSGGFSAPGYVGSRGGGVRLTLSLLKVVAGTRSEQRP